MLLEGMKSIAVYAVRSSRLSVIAIDVLRKDAPNNFVGFGHSCIIRHEHDAVVELVQAPIRMDMYRFHCPFPTCITSFCAWPESNAADPVKFVPQTYVVQKAQLADIFAVQIHQPWIVRLSNF